MHLHVCVCLCVGALPPTSLDFLFAGNYIRSKALIHGWKSILTFCKSSKMGDGQTGPERAEPAGFLRLSPNFFFCLGAPHFYIIDTGISSKSTWMEISLPSEEAFLLWFVYVQSKRIWKTYRTSSITGNIKPKQDPEVQVYRISKDGRIRLQVLCLSIGMLS